MRIFTGLAGQVCACACIAGAAITKVVAATSAATRVIPVIGILRSSAALRPSGGKANSSQ
jgi:hypothetical protein